MNKDSEESESGYVYVVTNDCYIKVKSPVTGEEVRPVKIGRGKNFRKRIGGLSSGVFEDFVYHIVLRVTDVFKCERRIHALFEDYRIRTKKGGRTEFFSCPLETIRQRVRGFAKDHPELVKKVEDFGIKGRSFGRSSVSQEAAFKKMEEEKAHKTQKVQQPADSDRREPFKFSMCKIKVGEKVTFVDDASKLAEVVDDRHVRYGKEVMSLSMLAKQLTGLKHELQGPIYFTYKGEVLDDLRKRLEK